MHTLRFLSRLWLLPLAALGAGCSSTGGSFGRSAEDSKIRTIASIGDRPISSTSGTPTSSAVANLETGERKQDGRDLVSGRVVDDQGEPVQNARVRVADGGLSGGKVVQAKTDRAGGFTLHGLRPGSTYTLIAEYEGQEGLVEGRSEVRSPQSEVEIAISGDEELLDRRRANRTPASRKISDRKSVEGPDDEDAQPLRLNHEDIPPASEVEDVDDLAGKTSLRGSRASAIPVSGWRRSAVKVPKAASVATTSNDDHAARRASTKPSSDPEPEDQPEPTAKPQVIEEPPPAEDDEGENPLPPAIEPSGKRGRGSVSEPDRDESAERPKKPSRRITQSKTNSPGPSPGALVLAKDAQKSPSAHREPVMDPFAETVPAKAVKSSLTFGDLTDTWKSSPGSQETNLGSSVPPTREVRARPEIASRRDSLPKLGSTKGSIEAVRYDAKTRRLIDFRLPDLDGRPVTLRDLDNDLILLDFWGTWCRPCLSSVPHMVELQKRLGSNKLTIVGIACEEGPASASAAHVAEVAEQLGINYTVLLSSKDEPSPLLEALHVQSFPTMIIIDRKGQVLWRDQGASDITLARLDRVVDGATRASVDRVRR